MFDETDTDSLEISPHDVWQLISDGTSELVLVDVREDYELTRGMLPGAIHRPLSRFGQYQQDWRTDVRYIIYCEHGVRSR